MRGLIYKDISIFFKSIDKKLILIAAAAIATRSADSAIDTSLSQQARDFGEYILQIDIEQNHNLII